MSIGHGRLRPIPGIQVPSHRRWLCLRRGARTHRSPHRSFHTLLRSAHVRCVRTAISQRAAIRRWNGGERDWSAWASRGTSHCSRRRRQLLCPPLYLLRGLCFSDSIGASADTAKGVPECTRDREAAVSSVSLNEFYGCMLKSSWGSENASRPSE